jgi:hypothetical protein
MILGVGYVAGRPELEAALRRKGVYGIEEPEMLAAFEVAMTPKAPWDHVVVGMGPAELGKAVSSADGELFWPDQPRFRILSSKMAQGTHGESKASGDRILATVQTAGSTEEATEAITSYLVTSLSRLLMIGAEEFSSTTKSLASFGVDSMVGAEFRSLISREFNLDVPFQELLAATVPRLASDLCSKSRGEATEA